MLKALKLGVTMSACSLILASGLQAGETTVSKEVVPPPKEDVVSGWLSFDYNTHFISYGLDVWGGGQSWRHGTFNPSAELTIALPIPGLKVIGGTWWDVNAYAPSSIGYRIQEVDVWVGGSYTYGPLTAKLLYQAWCYGSEVEHILDLTYSVDCLLHPQLVIHGRLDPGAAEGGGNVEEAGVFFVPGISQPFPVGPVTITPSLNVGLCTEEYHDGDGGYAYLALGLNGSVPVPFLPGDWSLHAGVTYYNTNSDVIPANKDDNFVTGNIGMTLSF